MSPLFDMVRGRQREQWPLGDAPGHLQDFVRTHRTCSQGAAGLLMATAVLEFTECLLDADAVVTIVGELRRAVTGELQLLPLQSGGRGGLHGGNSSEDSNSDGEYDEPVAAPSAAPRSRSMRASAAVAAAAAATGLTSWERGVLVADPGPEVRESHVGKVMCSDDPRILQEILHQTSTSAMAQSLLCGTAGRLRGNAGFSASHTSSSGPASPRSPHLSAVAHPVHAR